MCGIVGIVGKSNVNQSIYDALTVLQHRGQDAAGIATCDDGQLFLRKSNGAVRDVFRSKHMLRLSGHVGIGHVRYPTAGSSSAAEAQPFYVNSPYGITLAHNGNLTNTDELRKGVFKADLRHINTVSDSEVLLNVFAHEIHKQGKFQPTEKDVFKAVEGVFKRCRGAYAVVSMIIGYGIVGFRDPYGIRPIIYGKKETPQGPEYMISSESVALRSLGFEPVRDLAPGEAIFITPEGEVHTRQCVKKAELTPCMFEYVYLARPDSIIDGVPIYQARMKMGEKLAEKVIAERPNHDIDVVIPIPDTSRTSALEMAKALGVNYREGFIKNRYIGRTFIMPGQSLRKKSVRQKLNAIDLEFRGKNVMLVDDSIVRGTTCEQIIQMARDAGAKNVYFASASPAVKYPNVYGIDMPAAEELIAHGRTTEEIKEVIGADWLVYQELEDLIECVQPEGSNIKAFDCSVFNGEYVTGDIDEQYLLNLEKKRNDSAKRKINIIDDENDEQGGDSGEDGVIDLHAIN